MMFFVKKMVTPFVLPPGIFILIAMIGGLWLLRGKRYRMAWICLVWAGLLWLVSIGPAADALMGPLEAGFSIPADPHGDVIIMLGGGAYAKAPDFSGVGAPGPGTMARMVTAARLQRRLGVPLIVSGGKVYSDSGSVAQLTRRVLIDLGIPANMILVEDRSRDTHENALYCKAICDRHHFSAPLLVTSGYHLKRALLCFDRVGLRVSPFPGGFTCWPGKVHGWHAFLPAATSLRATSIALHEWLGILYGKLFY